MSDDYQLRKDIDRFKSFLDELDYTLQQKDILDLDIGKLFDEYYDSSVIDTKFTDLSDVYLTQSDASDTYAPISHNHNTWESVTLNSSYGTLYVNEALKLCEFQYYKQNVSFTGTGETLVDDGSSHNGLIPSDYLPITAINCDCYRSDMGALIKTDGKLYANTDSTGSKNVNCGAMWHYGGEQ